MDLIVFTALTNGGRITFFAQDVCRVAESLQELADGRKIAIGTIITMRDKDSLIVREPFDQVMDVLNRVWQGAQ